MKNNEEYVLIAGSVAAGVSPSVFGLFVFDPAVPLAAASLSPLLHQTGRRQGLSHGAV